MGKSLLVSEGGRKEAKYFTGGDGRSRGLRREGPGKRRAGPSRGPSRKGCSWGDRAEKEEVKKRRSPRDKKTVPHLGSTMKGSTWRKGPNG